MRELYVCVYTLNKDPATGLLTSEFRKETVEKKGLQNQNEARKQQKQQD
jgi:hypothetical protein